MAYSPIEDYALIGDCHGSALVARNGSVDWACLSRFDADAVFCSLLDDRSGGTFSLRPRALVGSRRRYLPNTNVLETRFSTRRGVVRVLDCFTMRSGGRTHPFHQLIRIVDGVEGEVTMDVLIQPRFEYATIRPWLRRHGRGGLYSATGGAEALLVQSDIPLEVSNESSDLRGQFPVRARQRRRFSIIATPSHELRLRRLSSETLDRRLVATVDWWRRWVAAGSYSDNYRDAVVRSALVLKLLTCAPTGAIIAAPTTSLPERIGGKRNWDYRYSWIRDSAHVLEALLSVGHPEVATGFKRFIERTTAGHADDVRVVYSCYGARRLTEEDLSHLDGYRGSRPVRIGNGAANQLQLDVYGELLNAAHSWRSAGNEITENEWAFLRGMVDAACSRWKEPDRGLWEMRGPPRHFVQSKVMCWLALERGIQAATDLGLPCDLDRWKAVRADIRAAVERKGTDPARGCFVQSFGSREVDASLLLLPIVGFVPARDPRMRATVKVIERELSDGLLVRRYRPERSADGLPAGEGAFLMASFWLLDVLAMQGAVARARSLFRRLLELANDVGLFAEQFDPSRRQMLGNFPQAFTHMALINSAKRLGLAGEAPRRAGRAGRG